MVSCGANLTYLRELSEVNELRESVEDISSDMSDDISDDILDDSELQRDSFSDDLSFLMLRLW